MGSLKCPLCCRAEFPNRRALQQHLLDVLDLLKCPTCSKSFTSILGLVQHLSLSSCNVEVGVNFDEHFVTYVDCSFMKTNKQENKTTTVVRAAEPPPKLQKQQQRPETVQQIAAIPQTSSANEVIIPDSEVPAESDMGVVIECVSSDILQDGEDIICINLEPGGTGMEILDNNKVLQKPTTTTSTTNVNDPPSSQTSRTEQECAKKIAVPIKERNEPDISTTKVDLKMKDIIDDGISYIYQCEICSQSFNSKSDFDAHECGNKFTCEICGTMRKTPQALKLHQLLHEREELEKQMNEPCTETVKCDRCDVMIGNNMAQAHLLQHAKNLKIFHCKLCPNAYLSMNRLNEHMKVHGDSTPYECNICRKEFKIFAYLKSHMDVHKDTKKFTCSFCEKSYHRRADKIKHEYIHTGEKPYECKICGKSFRAHFSLKVHLTTHSNERPYECTVCHKRFKSHAVYCHHIKLHGEARPYVCPHCPKTFKNQVALAGHKNRHVKPYSCDLCDRRFATKYDVKLHMPIHDKHEEGKQIILYNNTVYTEHKNKQVEASKVGINEESSCDDLALEHISEEIFIGQEEEVGGGDSKDDDSVEIQFVE